MSEQKKNQGRRVRNTSSLDARRRDSLYVGLRRIARIEPRDDAGGWIDAGSGISTRWRPGGPGAKRCSPVALRHRLSAALL